MLPMLLQGTLLLLPGPKPGSRHLLQALLLASQACFSREGAASMARHFEVGAVHIRAEGIACSGSILVGYGL
jgi:hypothetical protein